MSKQKTTRAKTSRSLPIFVVDTTSTTGGGLSGVTHASSGLVLEYRRQNQSAWTSVTAVSKTLGTYVSGGIVADGSLDGAYEVDFPDAAFASAAGVEWVALRIRGVANMLPVLIEIELDAVDYQDAAAFGLSRIDATIGSRSTLTAGGVRTELATELGRIDATVGSRATQTSVDTIDDFIDTEVAAIKAKTDNLPSDPADASDIAAAFVAVNSTLATIAGYVDTEVAAIKAKTDLIVTFPANFEALVITDGGAIDQVVSVSVVDELGESALSANSLEDQIAAAVAGIQVLSRLDSMIESDGSGQFRFDTIALENAPAGGGGGGGGGGGDTDWTANERTAIRTILGIPTSGTTPTDPSSGILDEIRDKTALIQSGGTVYVSSPVTATGQLASPLIIGDDYLAANGRRFRWTVALPSGYVIGTSTARFGMRYEDDEGVNSFIATGTVTDATGGNVHLDFDVAKTVTGTLRPGWYEWSVEIVSGSGVEITRVKSGKNAEWQEKQT